METPDLATPPLTPEPTRGRPGPRAGERIGPYLLVRLLGEGTSGRVFEVRHEKVDRRAALKLLDGALASRASARARFFAEALSVARIDNPHIVEVTDIVETEAHAGLVMELLEGVSLGAAMREGPLPPERFLPILADVCAALAAAHAAGFVHRDLKPENVFLCERHGVADFVKLLDFGIAAPLPARSTSSLESSSGVRRAFVGSFVGTPAYASPEQASGAPVRQATDIYAVGVMLYELATGRLPFEGWSARELLVQHMSAPVPRLPPELCATPLGRALDTIVQGCMAKEAHDRFSSAAELAAKLAALGRGEDVTIVTSSTPLGLPRRRRRNLALATAALGLVGLGALVVERAAPRTPPPHLAVASAPRPASPALVTLTFESEPSGAEARLVGGTLLGVTPFRRAFSRSASPITVELVRAGYEPLRLDISTAAPWTVSATLAPARALRPARRRAAVPKRSGHLGSEKTIDPFRR
jgi:serine/threonine-protein kinase